MAKKKKQSSRVRAQFRKRQNTRVRKRDFTKAFEDSADGLENEISNERLSGKGDLSRKRTVTGTNSESGEETGFDVSLEIDSVHARPGRVLSVHGLNSFVRANDGLVYECTVRGILKSLATDLQHVVVAGDFVTIELDQQVEENAAAAKAAAVDEPDTTSSQADDELDPSALSRQAVIVRVDHRRNQISRTSRKRQQIIVANVDLAFIVASAVEPALKPNLIDRFLVSAEKSGIQPVILLNKIDLVSAIDLQPVAGVWSQLGYPVILTSATTGAGVDRIRQLVRGRDCVVTGQSGVGKTSILNAIEPGLALKVSRVSSENQKGRHTTTAARLIPLSVEVGAEGDDDAVHNYRQRGHLVDTPGIRSFQLWDVIPEEVGGYFRDIRPFINGCKYPNCTHTHEEQCSVKWAVADGKIDTRRYESYCQMRLNDEYA